MLNIQVFVKSIVVRIAPHHEIWNKVTMNLHIDPLTDSSPPESVDESGPRQTRRSLPIALLRARESIMAKFRPMLARYNINEQQWRVIRVLGEHGELDATQLAERALVLGPSLTRMIKTLEKSRVS